MFRFAAGELLVVYLLVPGVLALFWWARARRRRDLARFGAAPLVERLTASVSRRARTVKAGLQVAALILMVTALARPQFGSRGDTVRREGQDVIVALDLSASMLADDVAPTRLDKAKLAIADLIDRLEGDRIGLIAFAGEAFVQSPLTLDYDAARLFLNAMDTDMISVPGTNLGQAIEVALGAFAETDRRHRVLVVLTDGEDHEGEVAGALERAVAEGVRLYTVGIGSTDGVPIPQRDEAGRPRGFARDENGAVVTTRLDEATLQMLAARTDGAYYHATPTGDELAALADEITGADGVEYEAEYVTIFEEQYQLFAGIALALLVVEVLVPERRARGTARWTGRFT